MFGICIPRVNKEQLNKQFIFNVFKKLEMGFVKDITIHGNGCVFVYFSKWFENERNNDIKKRLLNDENIYVIYEQEWGWFWKCSMLQERYTY